MTEFVAIKPEMKRYAVPAVVGKAGYGTYPIRYSLGLAHDSEVVISNVTWHEASRLSARHRCRLPTARELMEFCRLGYTHEMFDYYFGRNSDKDRMMEWSETMLVKPKNEKFKSAYGRKYWLREVRENGKAVSRLWIPESGFVVKWHPLGIPERTAGERSGTTTRFNFDANCDEIALYQKGTPNHRGNAHFGLCADMAPNYSSMDLGFRFVEGRIPRRQTA
jgi:hypothetical protein